MKKRDVIKQKRIRKQVQNMKYLKRSKTACVLFILMFLIYVGGYAQVLQRSYEVLLQKEPMVIVGFILCTANVYIWFVLKKCIQDMNNLEHLESIRLNLLVMVVGQLILLNFICAMLLLRSLRKYFQWHSFSFQKAIVQVREEKQLAVLIGTCVVLAACISLVFAMYFAMN